MWGSGFVIIFESGFFCGIVCEDVCIFPRSQPMAYALCKILVLWVDGYAVSCICERTVLLACICIGSCERMPKMCICFLASVFLKRKTVSMMTLFSHQVSEGSKALVVTYSGREVIEAPVTKRRRRKEGEGEEEEEQKEKIVYDMASVRAGVCMCFCWRAHNQACLRV